MPSNLPSRRSLQLNPKFVEKVRTAQKRSGFPSQNVLAMEVGLSRATVSKFFNSRPIDFASFFDLSEALNLDWQEIAYLPDDDSGDAVVTKMDWGDAPDPKDWESRHEERARLHNCITDDSCKVIAITGLFKIGKTQFVAIVARELSNNFDFVFWRGLQDSSKPEELLDCLITFLEDNEDLEGTTFSQKIEHLLQLLSQKRCLIVLKDLESVMQAREGFGQFKAGYEGYDQILRAIRHKSHQSTLILITREPPKETSIYNGVNSPIRLIQLNGLSLGEARKILADKEISSAPSAQDLLIKKYGGHPMFVRIAAGYVLELSGGSIEAFLEQDAPIIINGIKKLLDEAFERLSEDEKLVLCWIAIHQEAISEIQLWEFVKLPEIRLREALLSLRRRAFLELDQQRYSLPDYIKEHALNVVVDGMVQEIVTTESTFQFFNSYPLVQVFIKEKIQKSQAELLLNRVFNQLSQQDTNLEPRLKVLLESLSTLLRNRDCYAAANCLNLLRKVSSTQDEDSGKPVLKEYNFSGLTIRADLRGLRFHDVDFSYTDLKNSVFYEDFGGILAIALSSDSKYLVAGDVSHQVYLYKTINNQKFEFERLYAGHTHWVRCVAISLDSKYIASGSEDCTVRIWARSSGETIAVLRGYSSRVRSLAFSHDGQYLVSGSDDGTIVIWRVNTSERVATYTHDGNAEQMRFRNVKFSPNGRLLVAANQVGQVYIWMVESDPKLFHPRCLDCTTDAFASLRALALHPEGTIFATGHDDERIRLWSFETGELIEELPKHGDWIRKLIFSPNGNYLASSGEDGVIKIWDIRSNQLIAVLTGHTSRVGDIVFTTDGQALASGSDDQSVKLWDWKAEECLTTLQGYTSKLRSVFFSFDGKYLASGGDDGIIRIWDVAQEVCINQLEGHRGRIWSVAFSSDGKYLVSGSDDKTVKYWDLENRQCIKTFSEHTSWVRTVAISPDGLWVASAGDDKKVHLFNLNTYQHREFKGHADWILKVVFSPDGKHLISASDETGNERVKIWDVDTGECVRSLEGHTDDVRAVDITSDGCLIATGSHDKTIRLFVSIQGSEEHHASPLRGHDDWVRCVAFNPQGSILASGGYDQKLILWDTETWEQIRTLKGHNAAIISIAFSPDGQTLATCGEDATIRLWDPNTGQPLQVLEPERPYMGLNITGARGLNHAQRRRLVKLGATEE